MANSTKYVDHKAHRWFARCTYAISTCITIMTSDRSEVTPLSTNRISCRVDHRAVCVTEEIKPWRAKISGYTVRQHPYVLVVPKQESMTG